MKKLIRDAFVWLLIRNFLITVLLMTLCFIMMKHNPGNSVKPIFGALYSVINLLIIPFIFYEYWRNFSSFLKSDNKNYFIRYENTTPLKLFWWYTWRSNLFSIFPFILISWVEKVIDIPSGVPFSLISFFIIIFLFIYIPYTCMKDLFSKQHEKFAIHILPISDLPLNETKEQAKISNEAVTKALGE
jgi:hypothetical protein